MRRPPDSSCWSRWGVDPEWSRVVEVDHVDGRARWHVLEASPEYPVGTMVCLHGNPTWSIYWRSFLDRFGDRYRVIAPDHLGMGWSERRGRRRFSDRVDDVDRLLRTLGVDGSVTLVGHDWGGAIAMGWAVAHPERVDAMVLCNTGIAVPEGRRAPWLIRTAARPGVLANVCRRTPTFVRGTSLLSRSRLDPTDREALAAPYRSADERTSIEEFVGDVPFDDTHPSASAIADVADRLGELHLPTLLVWGAADPVFDDDFADDLAARLGGPVDVHRFPRAGHLVAMEADVSSVADRWLAHLDRSERDVRVTPPVPDDASSLGEWRPSWAALERRANDSPDATAFVTMADGEAITFGELAARVRTVASRLVELGVQPGDRVAVLVPPSIDTVAVVYGCWRAGAVTVVADRGLGLRGLGAAIRSARVQWLVGPRSALAVARAARWAPRATPVDVATLAGTDGAESGVERRPEDPAAVLFTSGATGPAKGVRYSHGQLAAQRDALAALYDVTDADRFVAAFAPFSLYGPALGIASALPDVDVTTPGRLTADALEAACSRLDATMVFASPAALANVVATAGSAEHPAIARLRLVMSAGAPVAPSLLRSMATLAPTAELRTPYGMTESLPVADIDLTTIEAAGTGEGVCVGHPVPGCSVMISSLGADGAPAVASGSMGEVLVRAAWTSTGYDRLWATQDRARPIADGIRWHRTGDVGHLDGDGRLWIEGRAVHVIASVDGPITPVPIEHAAAEVAGIGRAAAVGVGPDGLQQLVVVVEGDANGLAPYELSQAVRRTVLERTGRRVAAVCQVREMPVDIRHNAKIDRAALARWATSVLAGRP